MTLKIKIMHALNYVYTHLGPEGDGAIVMAQSKVLPIIGPGATATTRRHLLLLNRFLEIGTPQACYTLYILSYQGCM